ncbi:MAG: serine/threonine-protein kinase [Phycisphaerae bacterium]|nr:serine/threonine-protein kinase [Gemmatimonadaceae bacterium]
MLTLLDRISNSLNERYVIERELGQGGMATVFLAVDTRHERRVAIKVLHPELSAVVGAERFVNEIKLTAGLQHPHILPLFDSGVADGLAYYVMPFVEGETLRHKLDRERQLAIGETLRLASEIAGALQYAHERGVVHRDMKPENVLLQNGHAIVADFGIALAVQQAGGSRKTQTGMSLGTPQYMAPEQAMGERNVDARADVYALGAVTYEMLAGEPPFTGPTAQAIVAKVMTERSRALRSVRDTVPLAVDVAVATALEKLPADRQSSAREFAESLRQPDSQISAATRNPGAPAAGSRTPSRAAAFVALGALIGVAVAAAVNWYRSSPDSMSNTTLPLQFEVFPPDSVSLRLVCCGQLFAISPDGRYLAYQATPPSETEADSGILSHQLYLRDLTDLSTRALPGTRNARTLFFSPDNAELGFTIGNQLKRIRLSGGEPQAVATLPAGYIGGGTWSRGGSIFVAISGRMVRYSADGGTGDSLFTADTPDQQFFGPSIVDAAQVLLYSKGKTGEEPTLMWRSLKSGEAHVVAQGSTANYDPSANALLLVRSDGSLMRYPFDVTRGDTTGPPTRLATDVVLRSPVESHAEYTASQTGTVVLVTRERMTGAGGLTFTNLASGTPVISQLLQGQARFLEPHFSPDGRTAVLASIGQIGKVDAVIVDVARNAPTTLRLPGLSNAPTFTDRGDSLVYRSGQNDIYIAAANGSSEPRQLLKLKGWSGNDYGIASHGPWLAISATPSTGAGFPDIVVAHRDSGGRVSVYAAEPKSFKSFPGISPDGKWLLYTSEESGGPQVFVSAFPRPAGRYLVHPAGASIAYWGSDSRTLYFARANRVYSTTFTPGEGGDAPKFSEPKFMYTRAPWGALGISPDGKMLGFVDRVREGTPKSLVVRVNGVGGVGKR